MLNLNNFGKKEGRESYSYQVTEVANDGSFFIAKRDDGKSITFYANTWQTLIKDGKVVNMDDAKGTFSLKIEKTTAATTKFSLEA